jgi:hypothetical protein
MFIGQSITMFVSQFITWWSLRPSVAAVRHLVAQNAVALARDLALVHHQIEIDDPARSLEIAENPQPAKPLLPVKD